MLNRISSEVVNDAARVTRDIYMRNAYKLNGQDGRAAITEMQRAVLMDALANDDNLCEMLAGRIFQISHGTSIKG